MKLDYYEIDYTEIVKENKGFLFPTLVKRVVSHALVFRSDLDHSQIQQLQAKFFPKVETQRKLLVQRTQNKKKGNE